MSNTISPQEIYRAALDCGYDNCGIISPDDLAGSETHLQERMATIPESAGFYGGMTHFQPVTERFPWAKSIIVLTAEHGKFRYPKEMRGSYAKAFFLSAEEGHTESYDHRRFERWLTQQGIQWGGMNQVPLRYAAMKAGLGIIRKNNFLYTDKGSFVGLTAYVTDCNCRLVQNVSPRPCSDACTLCRRACKSEALCAPYTMNPLRCISFWTTFGKGNVPPLLDESMYEKWICGCDNCQDACPHNRRHNWDEGEPFSNLEEIAPLLVPERLLEQSDDFLREYVIPKTDHHLTADDTNVLRQNAMRAIRNKTGNGSPDQ